MATKLKVVIVDDDEDLLKMMIYAFQAEGLDVKAIISGKEALEFFEDEKNLKSTHLLILDRLLPDMDGLDILKSLNKKYPGKMPIVLVLSVLGAEKDVIQGLSAGAIEYLTKPFNLDVLMQQARVLLERYK